MTLPLVRVGDIAEQIRGVTFAKTESVSHPAAGYVPVLRAGNIQEWGLDFEDLVYVPADRVRDKQRVRRNDVVIAASSGSLDVVGKSARSPVDFEGGFGAFCKVLRPGPDVDPSYFAHYFTTPAYRRKISSLAEGANINNLKNEHLNDLLIPLPDLDEQRRIAAILDQTRALLVNRQTALAQLEDLAQSIFNDMFGDPVHGDDSWMVRLGDVAGVQIGPFGSLLHAEDYVTGGVPLINPMHIRQGEIVHDVAFSVSAAKAASLNTYRLRAGDVVMGRRGEMGRCAVVQDEQQGWLCGTGSIIVRPGAEVDAVYLQRALSHPSARRALEQRARGATLPNLNATIVKDLTIAVPPVTEQHRFTEALGSVAKQTVTSHAAGQLILDLTESIRNRAFSGRL